MITQHSYTENTTVGVTRLFFLFRLASFLSIGVFGFLLLSCSTVGQQRSGSDIASKRAVPSIEAPPWVEDIFTQEGPELYVTGGPSPSYEEARNMAYSEISYMIKTDVYAVTEDYINVSSDAVNSFMEEQVIMSTRASTNSVLSGVKVSDTYQDIESGQWWVRASISEVDLEQSKADTILQITQLQELFGEYRVYFADTIGTLLTGVDPYTTQIRLAISALEELYKLPSYDALIVSEGLPRSMHVYSFLTDFLQGAATTLSPKLATYPRSVKRGDSLPLEFSVGWDFETNIGIIPWKFIEKPSGKVVSRFITNSFAPVGLPLETATLGYGPHQYSIMIDESALGIDFSGIKTRVPLARLDVAFTVETPPVGLVVDTRFDSGLADDITSTLRGLLSSRLSYPIVEGERPVQIRVVIQDNQGTQGAHGIEFCHMGLKIEILSEGSVVYSDSVQKVKEAGLGYDLAARKAFSSLEKDLASTDAVFTNLDKMLTHIIEVEQ